MSPTCLHLSPTCLPVQCRRMPPLVSHYPHYTVSLLSHLSPLSCVPLRSGCFECFCPHDFAPVSRASTLWILCTQTGLPVRGSYSFERGACSGCMILCLPPGLFACQRHSGFFDRKISGLSLGAVSALVLCPDDFTFVSQCTLNALLALACVISHLSPTCLPLHSRFSARLILFPLVSRKLWML